LQWLCRLTYRLVSKIVHINFGLDHASAKPCREDGGNRFARLRMATVCYFLRLLLGSGVVALEG